MNFTDQEYKNISGFPFDLSSIDPIEGEGQRVGYKVAPNQRERQ